MVQYKNSWETKHLSVIATFDRRPKWSSRKAMNPLGGVMFKVRSTVYRPNSLELHRTLTPTSHSKRIKSRTETFAQISKHVADRILKLTAACWHGRWVIRKPSVDYQLARQNTSPCLWFVEVGLRNTGAILSASIFSDAHPLSHTLAS